METYNHLITQFHDSQTPPSNLLQLKSLADQLFRIRSSKKMQYMIKKNQLQGLQQQQQTSLSITRISATMRCSSLSSFSNQKQDTVEVDLQSLKKKKEELQKYISVLREKNQTLNNELQLFFKKQAEIGNTNKKAQLDVFNALQALYIEASRQDQEATKEQHLLKQLKSRRQCLAHQIELLVKDRQNHDEIIKKWSRIKELKAHPVKNLSEDPSNLKRILKTILKLHQIIAQDHQNSPQNYNRIQQFLHQIACLDNKLQITALLGITPVAIDNAFAQEAIAYHKHLENEFDRNERANKQINQHLQVLHNKNMELCQILEKANLQKQKQAKQHLKKTQFSLKQLQESFNSQCKVVSNFTTKLYMILKRMHSLKNTVNDILRKSSIIKQECYDDSDSSIIFSYDQQLNKNPEDEMVRWYQSLASNTDFYHRYIESNDLLRIISYPQSYNPTLDDLTNYQMFMVSCFRSVQDVTKKMAKEIKNFFEYCRFDANTTSSKNQFKAQEAKFCVQSMDYYRRDNYKLLQKLKQIQLRKKGLLVQIPFNVCLQNQLITPEQQQLQQEFSTRKTPKSTERNRKYMKYTELASKRQERSIRNSVVRKMLDQLNTIRSQSSNRFKTLNSLKESRLTFNNLKDWQRNSIKRISMPRKTVGTVQKENSERY